MYICMHVARVFQIQLLGYNSDLYGNVSQALASSNGLAMIALLGQVSRQQLGRVVYRLRNKENKKPSYR